MAGCFCFANPLGFLVGPSQKGTICSSDYPSTIMQELFIKKLLIFCTTFYVEFGALNQITHIFITSYPSPFGNNIFS
jgi:hypothetical protein